MLVVALLVAAWIGRAGVMQDNQWWGWVCVGIHYTYNHVIPTL